MKCEHCGAVLAPNAQACGYCRAPTAVARQAQQQAQYEAQVRAQWSAATAHRERSAEQTRLHSTASYSMWWSIASVLICCTPLSIVGLVQALRAKAMAKRLSTPMPTNAVLGLVLSTLSLLTTCSFYTYAIISSNQDKAAADARSKALDEQSAAGSTNAVLSHPTACALAESYALKNGYGTLRGPTLHEFECVGQITGSGKQADLDAFRFASGEKKLLVHACFAVGAKWYVTSLQETPCATK